MGLLKKTTLSEDGKPNSMSLSVETDSAEVMSEAYCGTVFPFENKQNGVVRHKQRLLLDCSTCVVVSLCLIGPHTSFNVPPVTILKFLNFEQRTLHFHVASGLSNYVNWSASIYYTYRPVVLKFNQVSKSLRGGRLSIEQIIQVSLIMFMRAGYGIKLLTR